MARNERRMVDRALKEARKILADPHHFTTGAFARNASGKPVDPADDDAVSFSVRGAFNRALKNLGYYHSVYGGNEATVSREFGYALGLNREGSYTESIVSIWSSQTKHADVLAALDAVSKGRPSAATQSAC